MWIQYTAKLIQKAETVYCLSEQLLPLQSSK